MTKVLVVEDDSYLLKLYKEVFEGANFQVETAEDGREALQKTEQFGPEVVLLDLMLPYIDGFGVLQSLKESPATEGIKVIILTNLDSQTQRDKALKLGADRFLVKTGNSPDLLVSEVKKILD